MHGGQQSGRRQADGSRRPPADETASDADARRGDQDAGAAVTGDPDATGTTDEFGATESLALIAAQHRHVERRVHADPVLLFSAWGLAWLLGFGAAYLSHDSVALVPAPVGVWTPVVLLLAALAWTMAYAFRTSRGVSGPSRRIGAMYGWSWTLGFAALFAMNSALMREGLTSDQAALLWSSSALLLTGALYLGGGMLWQDRFQYGLGVWSMLCGAGAAFAGVPGNFLVQAVAGGGGFLALAGYHRLRRCRTHPGSVFSNPRPAGETAKQRAERGAAT